MPYYLTMLKTIVTLFKTMLNKKNHSHNKVKQQRRNKQIENQHFQRI